MDQTPAAMDRHLEVVKYHQGSTSCSDGPGSTASLHEEQPVPSKPDNDGLGVELSHQEPHEQIGSPSPVTDNLSEQASKQEESSKPTTCTEGLQSGTDSAESIGHSWNAEECTDHIREMFGSKTVHSVYTCSAKYCNKLSKQESERILPKKFNHSFLKKTNWWLVYVEGEGMYCVVCKKHMMKHQNNKEVFSGSPGVRFKNDALNTHSTSSLHLNAIESDLVQKTSCFHQEFVKKSEVEYRHVEKAFSVAYFLMKELIANRKFQPLLDFIQTVSEDNTLQYFKHQSEGSRQEIFQTLGETIKADLVEKVNKSLTYGLLTDEVSDIAVNENLVTFVQFYCNETMKVETKFLSCRNILEDFESANAASIKAVLDLDIKNLTGSKLTGLASDGATVMTGKVNGVAALLRQDHPSLVNIHCVCHRLALSCSDSNDQLSYIKTVETLLRQLWQLFENSPKKMALYLKIQLQLKSINLPINQKAKVARRLKKACRTRWLSFDAAVSAVCQDFEAILQTLALLKERDAAAHGLLKKISSYKFLGTLYILHAILPVLSALSRHFQQDSLNFSGIRPAVNQCIGKLIEIKEDEGPLNKLGQDIDSFSDKCSDIKPNPQTSNELLNLLNNYVDSLVENINRRFSDTSEIIASLSIFDPTSLPKSDEVDFKTYGSKEITNLGHHFFANDVDREKLTTQWNGFKYYLQDFLLPKMPKEVRAGTSRITATEWLLLQMLRNSGLRHFNPELMFVAEAAASLPVSNAWPERGGSILKVIKTRQRNRLSSEMLEGLLHVAINGPTVEESTPVIKEAVKRWLAEKPRRKLGKASSEKKAPKSIGVQTEEVAAGVNPSREEIRAVVKEILLEGEYVSDDDNRSGSEDDDDWDNDCCSLDN